MEKSIEILTSEAVQLLKEMIAIESPSFHEDEVCTHISSWMTSKGIEHERQGNNIIAEHIVDPGAPTLMLCAHIDTVNPCDGYTFDPYKPQNSPEGVIQGLGSNDDGASAVSMIAAYRYHTSGLCADCSFQNRATPLAAGGGARAYGVGGVVFKTILYQLQLCNVDPCNADQFSGRFVKGLALSMKLARKLVCTDSVD